MDGKLGPDTVARLVAEYRAEVGRVPAITAQADRLAIRTRPNQRANGIDVNGYNDLFDAVLSHRDARLTLVMRIDFQFHVGPVGTALNSAQQRACIARFIRDVRRVWAEVYALVPIGPVLTDYLDRYYADILIINTNRNPHFVAHIGNTSGVYEATDPPGPLVLVALMWKEVQGGSAWGMKIPDCTEVRLGLMPAARVIPCGSIPQPMSLDI